MTYLMYSMHGFPAISFSGQYAFLIFVFTSCSLSSMKIAESGSDLDIFSWPCFNPMSMW